MKALTIREPYASLILHGIKKVETRTWKTNYRGELYIHSGISKMSKDILNNKKLMNLYDGISPSYGKIICKCNLVDVVKMTPEYIKSVSEDELVCGRFEVGNYAWILDDIEIINPIECKGKLGIWNYYEGN